MSRETNANIDTVSLSISGNRSLFRPCQGANLGKVFSLGWGGHSLFSQPPVIQGRSMVFAASASHV